MVDIAEAPNTPVPSLCHVLKSPLAAGSKSEPFAYAQTTSCIEQVRRAEQLSYTLARYRLCIIAIARHLTN